MDSDPSSAGIQLQSCCCCWTVPFSCLAMPSLPAWPCCHCLAVPSTASLYHLCLLVASLPGCAICCLAMPSFPYSAMCCLAVPSAAWECHPLPGNATAARQCHLLPCSAICCPVMLPLVHRQCPLVALLPGSVMHLLAAWKRWGQAGDMGMHNHRPLQSYPKESP